MHVAGAILVPISPRERGGGERGRVCVCGTVSFKASLILSRGRALTTHNSSGLDLHLAL
jgi:hypothetical protein